MRLIFVGLSLLAGIYLIGCSNDNAARGIGGNTNIIESQFIDAPVKGLSFNRPGKSEEKTGNAGKFICEKGELIEFKIGSLVLGHAGCGKRIFIQELISDNLSWQQAAAVIQSFSISTNNELDLSQVEIPQSIEDITSANFSSTLENAHEAVVNPPANFPSTVIAPTTAEAAANSSLVSFADTNMSADQKTIVGAYGATRKLYARKTNSTSSKECWDSYVIHTEIADASGLGEVKEFSVTNVYATDWLANLESNGTCSQTNENLDICQTIEQSRLPNKRFISSTNIDLIFSDLDASTKKSSSLSLALSGTGNNYKVTGGMTTIHRETQNGPLEVCHYNVSENSKIITDNEVLDPKGGAGTFSGALNCTINNQAVTSNFSIVIKGDPSSAHGYSADIEIEQDGVSVYSEDSVALTNDEMTPDDMPFLSHAATVQSETWNLMGYNNWNNNGTNGYTLSVNLSAGTCSQAVLNKVQ